MEFKGTMSELFKDLKTRDLGDVLYNEGFYLQKEAELLERYKKMEEAQQKISKRIEHLLDNKIHIKEFVRTAKLAEARKIMSWVNEALNH